MGRKVLIIDDSEFQRNRIKRALEPDGYDFVEGQSGYDALEMSARHAPDCMLLDLLMPDMNGVQVLEALQERKMDVPVVVLTADIQQSTHERCMELGAVAIVTKPYKAAELRAVISKTVGDRSEASDERN
jgi:CheY-like chemotaxis protein